MSNLDYSSIRCYTNDDIGWSTTVKPKPVRLYDTIELKELTNQFALSCILVYRFTCYDVATAAFPDMSKKQPMYSAHHAANDGCLHLSPTDLTSQIPR